MKKITITLMCCLFLFSAFAANKQNKNKVTNTLVYPVSITNNLQFKIALWPDGCKESNEITVPETDKNGSLSNVSFPELSMYLARPENNSGVTLIICPGGGYIHESSINEGLNFAHWLNEYGINVGILKYRLPNKHHEIPLIDAQQAIRLVRSNAGKWNLNPDKIGISGFSAGGHLASTAGTHFDYGDKNSTDSIANKSCRPDFMILFYPVVSMKDGITHKGSQINLLGDNPSEELIDLYCNEKHVDSTTPPTLIFLSDDDKAVIPQNSIDFYKALKINKVPSSIYIFPEGGHGWGFKPSFRYHDIFKSLMIDWLKQQKIL